MAYIFTCHALTMRLMFRNRRFSRFLEVRPRLHRAAKIALAIGKWAFIIYAIFSLIITSYIFYIALFDRSSPKPASVLLPRYTGEDDTAEDTDRSPNQTAIEEKSEPLQLETPQSEAFLPELQTPRSTPSDTGKNASDQGQNPFTESQLQILSKAIYPPAFLLGKKDDKRILFFWSAESYDSILYFRQHIAPLVIRKQKNYSILLVQLASTSKEKAVSPGGTLFCANTSAQYQDLVLNLFKNAKRNPKVTNMGNIADYSVKIDSSILSAFSGASMSGELAGCLTKSAYRYKLAQWYKQTELFVGKYNIDRVRFVVVDGKALKQPDANTILSAVRQR